MSVPNAVGMAIVFKPLKSLPSGAAATVSQLIAKTGLGGDYVRAQLQELCRRGLVEQTSAGYRRSASRSGGRR